MKRLLKVFWLYLSSWIFPLIISCIITISFVLSCCLLLNFQSAVEVFSIVNSVIIDGTLAIIAALFALIAIIQAVASSAQAGSKLEIIVKSKHYKVLKRNELATIVVSFLLIVLAIFYLLIDKIALFSLIASWISLELLIFGSIICMCIKHFRVVCALV